VKAAFIVILTGAGFSLANESEHRLTFAKPMGNASNPLTERLHPQQAITYALTIVNGGTHVDLHDEIGMRNSSYAHPNRGNEEAERAEQRALEFMKTKIEGGR
jgi:hypothetical protein